MTHESKENPAPTPVGFSCGFCIVRKDSGTQACHKADDVKSVPNSRAYRPSIPKA